jgi:hypothetical protein
MLLKQLTVAFVYAIISCSSWADEGWLFNRLSPDLKKFMVAHPAALTVLSNSFSEAFSNRTVSVFYFYSTNEAEARAEHIYPGAAGVPDVLICVRENQHPLDQFITLLFETLNSRGERQFKNLTEDAYNGSVSKDVFVNTIRRLEFAETVNTRALLVPLHFSKKEIRQSRYHKLYMECPLDFEGYIAYSERIRGKLDPVKFYENEYDELRKRNPNTKPKEQSKPEPKQTNRTDK